MDIRQKIPMPKQNSSFMFISIIDYIEKKYPEINMQDVVDELNSNVPFYIENLKTGEIELVSLKHIKDEDYWFSHPFINSFSKIIEQYIHDPDLFYEAGNSVYHTQNFLKTAVGMPFLGPQKMVKFLQRENDKFNRTKDIELLKSKKGHAIFRVIFFEGIVPSPHGMEWGAGLLRSYIKLSGATEVEVKHKWLDYGPKNYGDKGRGICEFEVRYKDPGILKRLAKSLIFNIPIVKKEIDYATEILTDHKEQIINRERIIEEKTNALKKANEKLLHLDKLKTEFYTNITHELRTPLTLIKSQIEAVQKGHFGQSIESSSDIFDSVNKNAEHLSKLITNLLDFSKIESGKMDTSFQRVSLFHFLRQIYLNIESAVQHKNLTFEYINNTQSVYASLDKNLFEKAIYNLLSNAIKFTPPGGYITLLLDETKNEIIISVKDTGIGIAKENHTIIFERFHQVDSSPTRKYEGTGIGLSLAREIINLHTGDIKLESTPNEGTTFTIIIPKMATDIDKGNKKDINRANEKHQKIAIKKKIVDNDSKPSLYKHSFSVIIVEDNDDLQSFIKKLIIPKYNVFTAKNGIEALSILNEKSVDLVISDIMMPEMDGVELLKEIRQDKNFSWIPVIMLTARADFPMKMKGFSHGANDYIIKPFQPDELLARVKSQLSLVILRREYKAELKNKKQKALTDKTILAIEKVQNYIEQNYKEDISRDNLSSIVEMSPDHLSRMFKKHTGKKIGDFVNELRIESILNELENNEKRIVDIAFDAGFESLSSFNRIFKNLKKMSPSEYKKKL